MYLTTLLKIAVVGLLAVSSGFGYLYFKQNSNEAKSNFEENKIERKIHECVHDEYMKEQEIFVYEQEPSPIEATLAHEQKLRRQHKQGNWQPIRVNTDFSNVETSQDFSDFIQKKLIPAAIGFLEGAYRVYPKTLIDEVEGRSTCGGYSIPSDHQQNGVSDADLVLYVGTKYASGENWLARAGPCLLDRYTLRPVAGTVEFNTYYLSKVNINDPDDDSWYGWIQTTIHEMTHVLAFSQTLFNYYVDPSTNQRLGKDNVSKYQSGRYWVILDNVVHHTQQYFGCSSSFGAPLENNGGGGTAGSHWERVTFGNEAMTGSDFPDSVFSRFTFELLKGSGWYLPVMSEAQTYVWGQGEGCQIAQGQCPQGTDEFCSDYNEDLCAVDYMGTAHCSSRDTLAGGCSYWSMYGNMDCREHSSLLDQVAQYTGGYVGSASRCWQTTLPKSVGYRTLATSCYKSICSSDKTSITVTIGNNNYTCSSDGQVINVQYSYYSGTLTCPEIKRFCNYSSRCPNDCSGRGTCKVDTCDCWDGFGGNDCSQITE